MFSVMFWAISLLNLHASIYRVDVTAVNTEVIHTSQPVMALLSLLSKTKNKSYTITVLENATQPAWLKNGVQSETSY